MDKVITHFDWLNKLEGDEVRNMAACWVDDKYFDEYFTIETAPIEMLRSMIEDAIFDSTERV